MPTFVADEIVTAAKLNSATARDWTTWSPSYTNLNVGTSGTTVARYVQVGKMIHFSWTATLGGTGFSVADIRVTLPVTSATTSYVGLTTPIGSAMLGDTGTANVLALCLWVSSTTFGVRAVNVGTSNWGTSSTMNATTPFTWAAGDILSATGTYEAA